MRVQLLSCRVVVRATGLTATQVRWCDSVVTANRTAILTPTRVYGVRVRRMRSRELPGERHKQRDEHISRDIRLSPRLSSRAGLCARDLLHSSSRAYSQLHRYTRMHTHAHASHLTMYALWHIEPRCELSSGAHPHSSVIRVRPTPSAARAVRPSCSTASVAEGGRIQAANHLLARPAQHAGASPTRRERHRCMPAGARLASKGRCITKAAA